ncbi:MAG: hypothetical protein HY318_12040 [Armatimonadetes bacterium]|nr:hypothetical protein [Armatimonadota bacterium]
MVGDRAPTLQIRTMEELPEGNEFDQNADNAYRGVHLLVSDPCTHTPTPADRAAHSR